MWLFVMTSENNTCQMLHLIFELQIYIGLTVIRIEP